MKSVSNSKELSNLKWGSQDPPDCIVSWSEVLGLGLEGQKQG